MMLEDSENVMTETEINTEPLVAEASVSKKKSCKKVILFVGIGIGVAAILILVIYWFFGGSRKSENNYVLYLKDNGMVFNDLKKSGESWYLTSKVFVEDDMYASSEFLGVNTYMSEDGKYIFFPDKIENDDYSSNRHYDLCYREADKPDVAAVRIDSDVRYYAVNTDATVITYYRGREWGLYQYKMSDGSKNKIAGDVFSIAHISADGKTVYYFQSGSLYKWSEDGGHVKIDSDIVGIPKIYDTGEIYYMTQRTEEVSLLDYVNDDMRETDALITEPVYPAYPSSPVLEKYDTYAEFEAAYASWEAECDHMKNEYNNACEVYLAKVARDKLRSDIEKEKLKNDKYSLLFFDGTKKVVIADDAGDLDLRGNCASDIPVIFYNACDKSNIGKVKLSDIESIDDIKNMLEHSETKKYIAFKDTSKVLEQELVYSGVEINSSGTVMYCRASKDSDGNIPLYRIDISDGIIGKAEVYDSNVEAFNNRSSFVSDSDFAYFKKRNDTRELYINKKKIAGDVIFGSVAAYSDLGKVFYYTGDNETLMCYDGEEAVKIADDVESYSVTPDGRVIYLCNYDNYHGELYEWSNGETRKIDDSVVALFPVIYSRIRNYDMWHYLTDRIYNVSWIVR